MWYHIGIRIQSDVMVRAWAMLEPLAWFGAG